MTPYASRETIRLLLGESDTQDPLPPIVWLTIKAFRHNFFAAPRIEM